MTEPMSDERLTADDMAAAWRRTLDSGGTIGPLARLTLGAIEDRARLREQLAATEVIVVHQMQDQAAALEENSRLRTALKDVAVGLECGCDEAYVKRGRHEPNALCYLLPDVLAALSPEATS